MNPILSDYEGCFNEIPFSKIKLEHFMPGIMTGISETYNNIEKIINDNNEANFKNVIEKLEIASETLNLVTNLYFNLYSLDSTDEFKKLSDEISPLLAKLSGDIFMNDDLFVKVKKVYDNKDKFELNNEELRLLEITYTDFVRNGALLNNSDKLKLKQIDEELSTLGPQFSKNSLNATNAFELIISNEEELKGVPENSKQFLKHQAEKKGYLNKWLINLQMPSYMPIIQYAENRNLREKLSKAYSTKNLKGDFDNTPLILKIVNLKDKRGKILGYKDHSSYVLEKRMANKTDIVLNFLDSIYEKALPKAQIEIKELTNLAKEMDNINNLESWDYQYYSQKLKQKKFNFDNEELRPYLKSDNVINGIFNLANKLYGISFHSVSVDTYHESVNVFKVLDDDNNFIGLLYIDLFPRETKTGGAWMNTFITQGLQNGKIDKPHVLISGNFTPSTPDTPSLLSFDEARTLFHEFGHALHGLFSNVTYKSLASPNVLWDFVELPSQIMENWLLEEETLELFAKHYISGENLPNEFINKIKDSQTYNAGYMNIRQLSFAYLDMAWHTTNPCEINSVEGFEDKIMERFRLFPKTDGNMSSSFGHIFAGGYSSGYYSYKWAEVLDADSFEFFKENGIFNKEIGKSFREHILSKGNTVDPMILYKKFRGKEPDTKSLLKREGLI